MILLYTLVLVLLGLTALVVGRRTRRLEKQYVRAAQAVDQLLKINVVRPGNSNKLDLCLAAKRYYLLGQLVADRDRLEQRYLTWQQRADRLNRALEGVRGWKGRKLPYTFGALDVSGALWVIDHLGTQKYVGIGPLLEYVKALLSG